MTYDISTLTENQIALLKGILEDQFSEGPDFGAWYDDIATVAADKGIIKTKQQTKASLNQLIRKNVLAADTTKEEGSSWITLTAAGGDALSAIADAEAPSEDEPDAVEEDDEDLLGDTGAVDIVPAPAPAPVGEEDDEDLLGDVSDVEAAPVKEQVVSHTENYTVNEWVDGDDSEWTETLFADGSRTLKRRREVSGSWRTDYWGAEATADKEKATSSKLCKIARTNGHFTHTLPTE